jgi:hypothetical protein
MSQFDPKATFAAKKRTGIREQDIAYGFASYMLRGASGLERTETDWGRLLNQSSYVPPRLFRLAAWHYRSERWLTAQLSPGTAAIERGNRVSCLAIYPP